MPSTVDARWSSFFLLVIDMSYFRVEVILLPKFKGKIPFSTHGLSTKYAAGWNENARPSREKIFILHHVRLISLERGW